MVVLRRRLSGESDAGHSRDQYIRNTFLTSTVKDSEGQEVLV